MRSKKGLPKALERELEQADEEYQREESLSYFLEDMFPTGTAEHNPDDKYPPLDWLKSQFQTKSAVIRYCYNLDPRPENIKLIAKHLGIRYQMIRNVVTNILKRGPNEDWTKPYKNTPLVPPTTQSTHDDDSEGDDEQ